MRIDQYLWCIRLYRSRNLASSQCKKGMVKVNGQKAKPSRDILPLDKIEIRKEQIWREFQILDIPKSRMGAKLVALYVIEKTNPSVFDIKKLKQLSASALRDEGKGRPTKKERREIDDLFLGQTEEED
ncbi:MAG: ribosome-associated heat shock protein Hsp15 [Flavobacteriaceae bacterium]|jgi:ribosome-associated heat shock protein Hsp15|tara:strand:- start:1110 stop:1493 length:384 start_codon:yes stop_codon:yes gene_type:complete